MKKFIACLLSVVTMVATLQTYVPADNGQPLGKNVAFHRNVEVSNPSIPNDYNKLDFLTDGDIEKGYQAALTRSDKENPCKDEQIWSMDLGRDYEIDKVVLYWESAAAKKYDIYTSIDKKEWTKVATEENGQRGRFKYDFNAQNIRYVKIELHERVSEGYGYCMYEWQVFTTGSTEEKEMPNLALDATATASSEDENNNAQNAIDGDETTMWRSAPLFQDTSISDEDKANENITLSWQTPQTFDTIKVIWNGGYMKGYKFQVSDNGEDWIDLYEVTDAKPAEKRTVRLDKAVTTSYLRLQGVTYGAYCFEIKEIQVCDQTYIPVEYINLNYTNIKLNLDRQDDSKIKLEYLLAPSNTSQQEVVWSSSNDAVAEVKDGVVTGKSVGVATVTIASKDNPEVKKICTVYVSKELDKSNVTATRNDHNVNVQWSGVNHASSYVLTRYNKLTANETVVYEGTAKTYEDKDLPSGKYVYIVKAIVDENDANANLYSNSISEESDAVIIPEPVTGVEIANDYQNVSMFVGGSQQIKYGVLPSNATNTNVTFKSLDESIATVDKNGVVTGVSRGNTKVVVTTEEGGFTAECTVNVDGIEIKDFQRVGDRNIAMGLSETHQLQVSITPENATDKNIQWTSTNESVASVDKNGLVTSKNSGTAIITAKTSNGLQTDFLITVDCPVNKITLNKSSININPGKTLNLTATVSPSNASNKKVTWISANESVATVSGGVVTGKKIGTTYVSAISADGKIIATCTVTVSKPVVTKPAKVNLKSAKKKGTKVTLKWKKITDTVGYVVYMKTNSGKFKLVKTIKKAKTVKCVIKLKKGNKYSFKVRAYKLDGETKVYGAYSKVKKIKM